MLQNVRRHLHLVGHPRNANLYPYTWSEDPLLSSPLLPPRPTDQVLSARKPVQQLRSRWRCVSLDQRGFGSLHSAGGEGNGINLRTTHLNVPPNAASVHRLQPLDCPNYKCTKDLLHWNNDSKPHLNLIVQWMFPWKEWRYYKLLLPGSQLGKTRTEVSPRDSTRIVKSCCETWSTEKKMECLGFNPAKVTSSQATNWDQETRNWAEHFASALEHWSSSPTNYFLLKFLHTMTFYPSFFKPHINFTVKHLSSPTSMQQNTFKNIRILKR